MFLDHTQRRSTVGRTPLDNWSASRQHTTLTTDKYPCPRWDLNPSSQQANGLWPLACWVLETSKIGAPYIYIYDISSLKFNDLTLILLTWRKWWAPNNTSKQQMGFNLGFKGLIMLSSLETKKQSKLHNGLEVSLNICNSSNLARKSFKFLQHKSSSPSYLQATTIIPYSKLDQSRSLFPNDFLRIRLMLPSMSTSSK
jgi:hypothetical protein